MTETPEIWKPIEGFERLYEVSNLGRVRSLDRLVHQVNRWGPMASLYRGRVLISSVASNGYLQVTLSKGGASHQRHPHSLMARAFLGPPIRDPSIIKKPINRAPRRSSGATQRKTENEYPGL
jgi:hypothetical protein